MKIRDIERKGECIIQLQGGFTEQVKMIHYNENKNVLFASSKDGQFKVWKMPHEWRAKSIDRKEMEAEYERRKSERLRKTGKSTGKWERAPNETPSVDAIKQINYGKALPKV